MNKMFNKQDLEMLANLEQGDKAALDRLLLSDFSHTLERQLEVKLRNEYPKVILINPTTGKTASCVSHVLRVLAFGHVNNWRTSVRNKAKALEGCGVFEHQFSGYRNPTICVDIDRVDAAGV